MPAWACRESSSSDGTCPGRRATGAWTAAGAAPGSRCAPHCARACLRSVPAVQDVMPPLPASSSPPWQIAAAWLCGVLYTWSLVAHRVLKDRTF